MGCRLEKRPLSCTPVTGHPAAGLNLPCTEPCCTPTTTLHCTTVWQYGNDPAELDAAPEANQALNFSFERYAPHLSALRAAQTEAEIKELGAWQRCGGCPGGRSLMRGCGVGCSAVQADVVVHKLVGAFQAGGGRCLRVLFTG